jgi:hypothetical protein
VKISNTLFVALFLVVMSRAYDSYLAKEKRHMQTDPSMETMLRIERRILHYGFEPTREQFHGWLMKAGNDVAAERRFLLLEAYEQGKTYDDAGYEAGIAELVPHRQYPYRWSFP